MRSLIALILSFLAFAPALHAANGAGDADALTTYVEREPINTIEPIFRAYVNIGADKFTFIIPHHFQLGGNPERGLLRVNDVDSDCSISFSIVAPLPVDSTVLDAATYKELVAKRHSDGKITSEFTTVGLGNHGPGFDVDWKSDTGLYRSTRTIFLPSVAGVLELSVTSSAKKFPEAQASLNSMLGTLRASFGGKLIVSRLDDRS